MTIRIKIVCDGLPTDAAPLSHGSAVVYADSNADSVVGAWTDVVHTATCLGWVVRSDLALCPTCVERV